MIVKKRAVPRKLQVLEALIRRLPASHSKFPSIKEDYTKRIAGFHGEKQIDFHLTSLPPDSFSIFHDLRLPYKQHFFQMDSLLLSKKFAVILEIKNVTGTLLFDQTFNQLIRTTDGKEEGFQSPLVQVESQRRKLLEYFQQNKLPLLPTESFIVVSNPRTIIKASGNIEDISRKAIHSEYLTEKLNEVKSHYAKSPSYSLEKMRISLLDSHIEEQVNAYTFKGIRKSEIRTGVQCPDCKTFDMERVHSKWICSYCKSESRDAHLQAIADYMLLFTPFITNHACQQFLHIDRHTAKRLLSKNFSAKGYSNQRKYYNK